MFSYLVVPAVCAVLFCDRLAIRLTLGWPLGLLDSVLGLSLSFVMDLPTGASIFTVFGVLTILSLVAHRVLRVGAGR